MIFGRWCSCNCYAVRHILSAPCAHMCQFLQEHTVSKGNHKSTMILYNPSYIHMHLVLSVLTLYILTLIHMYILHSPEEFVQQSRPDNRFLILGKFVGLTYLRTIMKMNNQDKHRNQIYPLNKYRGPRNVTTK